jgi:hypothetical protein
MPFSVQKQHADERRMHAGTKSKLQAAHNLLKRVKVELCDAREEIKRLKQIINDLCEEEDSKKKR